MKQIKEIDLVGSEPNYKKLKQIFDLINYQPKYVEYCENQEYFYKILNIEGVEVKISVRAWEMIMKQEFINKVFEKIREIYWEDGEKIIEGLRFWVFSNFEDTNFIEGIYKIFKKKIALESFSKKEITREEYMEILKS